MRQNKIKTDQPDSTLLENIARKTILDAGLIPDFPKEIFTELKRINDPAEHASPNTRDLRQLCWCSLDNDDSRDLDQLTVAEALPEDATKLMVAVADVASLVPKNSALDSYAQHNTTSIYTPGKIFPMLPDRLSTDLTSLNLGVDRLAIVIEIELNKHGSIQHSDIYPALVHNHAKLAYNSVGSWLEGKGSLPLGIDTVPGLEDNLRLQDRCAQLLKALRHENGALTFETIEAKAVFANEELIKLEIETRNRAKDLIEDLMVVANGVMARYLANRKIASLRRVVRTPKNWPRIVELASDLGCKLPSIADSKALEKFLESAKARNPMTFADLSLSVIKLLGPGEYILELPGADNSGHFGLAVKDYAHSTAPNRRYPDLITQRIIKSLITGQALPYTNVELNAIAVRCTEIENTVKKIVRRVEKSAAALLLESKVGEQFDGIVTGASDKGTWVRLMTIPVEGKLINGTKGLEVGERVNVKLQRVDVKRGFIDFAKMYTV